MKRMRLILTAVVLAMLTGCGQSGEPDRTADSTDTAALEQASKENNAANEQEAYEKAAVENASGRSTVENEMGVTDDIEEVKLTSSEYKSQRDSLEAYLDEVADSVDMGYQGELSLVYADFGNVCLSKQFPSVEITRTLYENASKVDYTAICEGKTLFTTQQYVNFPNSLETFAFYDVDKDNCDEILVSSYTESTAGFVVTEASIFRYDGEKWSENIIFDYENGVYGSNDNTTVRDIILGEEGVVFLRDSGEKDGADVIIELYCEVYSLVDSGIEFTEQKDDLIKKYWPNDIY